VAAVAADLGIEVIYEGIEDQAVEDFLRTSFGGYGQGFAIARPMPIEDLVRWSALRDVPVDPAAIP
jgi:EAL domain-containing protein (putative c-di-GMP-specific phosphodiesterase class I)